jgi:hypothetical protein
LSDSRLGWHERVPLSITPAMREDFRRWFSDQLDDQELTVAALSGMLRVRPPRVEAWLQGRARPTRRDCANLAQLLEAPSFVVLDLAGYNPT